MSETTPKASKLKVFVSYSREDLEFADQLVAGLEACGFTPTIDRKGIHGAEKWEERLLQLILQADTVVFVLTPESAASEVCRWEVDEALKLGKRIVPILWQPLGDVKPHEHLRDLNYIHFYTEPNVPDSGFGGGLKKLDAALSVDVEWIREHTRLSELATHWHTDTNPADLLVRGSHLAIIQKWRDTRPANAPELTTLQTAFIGASEEAEHERENAMRKQLQERERLVKNAEAAQEAQAAALKDAEAAQKAQAEALKDVAREQKAKAAEQKAHAKSQRRSLYLVSTTAAIAALLFAGTIWQARVTARREAILMTSAAQRAIDDGHYVRAMRIAIQGLPPPNRLPIFSLDWESSAKRGLEAKLAGAAHASRLKLKLVGHTAGVMSAVFSPDGTRIVTASASQTGSTSDNTARVWDANSGRALLKLEGHEGDVWRAAFSPNGSRIVTASGDNTARVWDANTGRELLKLEGPTGTVWSAAFSPDGTRVVTASGGPDPKSPDNTARVWDANSGRELLKLEGHSNNVWSAAFSPDGTLIVTAAGDETEQGDFTARVWDANSGVELLKLEGHTSPVTSAVFSPDGTRIVTTSDDNTARVWETSSGREILKLEGHSEAVRSAEFSPDGARIVTASDDNTAWVWDSNSGQELFLLEGHTGSVKSATFSQDGTRVVTASGDSTARVWNAQSGHELLKLEGHLLDVESAMFSPDGNRIVTAALYDTARVWDARSGQQILKLEAPGISIMRAAFSPDGARVVTAPGGNSFDPNARIWNTEWLVNIRGPELVRRACEERLVPGAKQFTPQDAGDAILAGLSGTNPCERVGPLSLEYWARMFR